MRKLIICLICSGLFFSGQVFAADQCSFDPGDKIHCSTCTTLNNFAFYGASALSANKGFSTSSIQVTGNNGSHVIVTKGLFWQPLSFSVSVGRWGSWGADLSYPSRTLAQVYAQDVNGLVNDPLNNDGRMLYVALNAKCSLIEEEEAEREEEENENEEDSNSDSNSSDAGAGYSPPTAPANDFSNAGYDFVWYFGGGGNYGTPVITTESISPCLSQPGDGSSCD